MLRKTDKKAVNLERLQPFAVNLFADDGGIPVCVYSNGLPFHLRRDGKVWRRLDLEACAETSVPCGWTGRYLSLLGHLSTLDAGTGSWYTKRGDLSAEQFIGDRLGDLEIVYEDGKSLVIPLVFGFTLWWDAATRPHTGHGPYAEPFATSARSRRVRDKALMIRRFHPDHELSDAAPAGFVSLIELRPAKVESLNVRRAAGFKGYPAFSGVTLLATEPVPGLQSFPQPMQRVDLAGKPVLTAANVREAVFSPKVRALQHELYTFNADCAKDFDEAIPEGFQGPRVRLGGGRHARMLTNIYFANLHDLVAKTDGRNHMTPTSTPLAPAWGEYRQSIGTWRATCGRGHNPDYAGVWSRDGARAGMERRRFGLGALTPREIESFDRCLYRVTPPHWTRDMTNPFNGHSGFIGASLTGKPVLGHAENDGHGQAMLLRYQDWLASGRSADWLAHHWQATVDAAEWIVWVMDEKLSDQQPDDTLWSFTEPAGWRGVDACSNILCLYGLLASAEIAGHGGKAAEASRWRQQAERLRKGAERHLAAEENGSRRWVMHPKSSWQDGDETLTPIVAAADFYGYLLDETPWDAGWWKLARNTYEAQIASEPRYNHVRAFGYGQGYIAQAALLLDEMDDAGALIERLCDYGYSPKLQPWIVPEGAVVHPSGEYWYRSGDHGNTAQQVEVLKVIRLIVGIDDLTPGRLTLVPRLPTGLTAIAVEDYPVLDASGDHASVTYRLERRPDGIAFECRRTGTNPLRVRLGPIPAEGRVRSATPQPAHVVRTGSGCWAWFELPGETKEFRIEFAWDARPEPS